MNELDSERIKNIQEITSEVSKTPEVFFTRVKFREE